MLNVKESSRIRIYVRPTIDSTSVTWQHQSTMTLTPTYKAFDLHLLDAGVRFKYCCHYPFCLSFCL